MKPWILRAATILSCCAVIGVTSAPQIAYAQDDTEEDDDDDDDDDDAKKRKKKKKKRDDDAGGDDDDDDDEAERKRLKEQARKERKERRRKEREERERKEREAAEKAAAEKAKAEEEANKPAGDTDHSKFIKRFGVSWFGATAVPIALGGPAGDGDDPAFNVTGTGTVDAPAIGIRYWMSEMVGIDAGFGMSVSTGSISNTTSQQDKQTVTAFLLHAGVPLALVNGKHISLQVGPEMNFGYAQSEVEPAVQPNPPPAATVSGFRFDLGARLGAEVHWGFIGIPELTLEGSIGAYLTAQGTDISVGEANGSDSNLLFTTAEYSSPWDIFTQHVRARYYF